MSQILFIHSAGPQGGEEGSAPLLADLKKALEPPFEIIAPTMPDAASNPTAKRWDATAARAIAAMKSPYVLVGHSLGASTLLKCLATDDPPPGLRGVVLIAAPYWGEPDWDVESFAMPPGFDDRLAKLPSLLFIASRDDEVAPFGHSQKYAEAIPGARLKLLDGHGHEFARGSNAPVGDAIRGLF